MKFVHVPPEEAIRTKAEIDSSFVIWTWQRMILKRMILKTREEWKR